MRLKDWGVHVTMYGFIYRGMMTHGNDDDMSHENNKEEDERRIEKEGR